MRFLRLVSVLAFICLFLATLPATATPIVNYDPFQIPPAPVLGAGWAYDQINFVAPAPSLDSPYIYVLATQAIFRITDDFVMGDVYTVLDFGAPILVTGDLTAQAPLGGPGPDPAGWLGAGWAKGSVLLAPGAHSLTVEGTGQVPAGFYTRIDSTMIPEPATYVLLGLGLGAIHLLRRRVRR